MKNINKNNMFNKFKKLYSYEELFDIYFKLREEIFQVHYKKYNYFKILIKIRDKLLKLNNKL
jgi:hypothetical protein